MKKVLVYSHDTFGLGNIRRMLAISEHLLETMPDTSVLLITGSPMAHGFRMHRRLDYIKLPCLSRTGREEYSAKSLGTGIDDLMAMRSNMILSAARNFDPDVVLIDKKPDGVKHELRSTLEFFRRKRPRTRLALVLRDILDSPEATILAWRERKYHDILRSYFDSVLVLGAPEVFDTCEEYEFPPDICGKTRYCGYVRKSTSAVDAAALRHKLLQEGERKIVLVTPGGGEDGYHVVDQYLKSLDYSPAPETVRSVVVCGPEMPAAQREQTQRTAAANPRVTALDFTGELLSYMAASDVVVSMAGYNTISEILSLEKRAVTVPRVRPVSEQWIRAERLARRGMLAAIHPDELTPRRMAKAVWQELTVNRIRISEGLWQDGLDTVSAWVAGSFETKTEKAAAIAGRALWNAKLLMC
ncbi:MAG: glycosyltransferase [Bryobacteraceae bacterium]|nr:glycosyltransferase [Bryobacteraceae bacterium]